MEDYPMARVKSRPGYRAKSSRNRNRRPSTASLSVTARLGRADLTKRRASSNGNAYEVGYRKPPKAGQWRKGVSGNRRGRTKGAKNFSTLLTEALNEHVTVMENGSRRTVSKLELMLKQLADQGADGNLRALSIILQRVDPERNRTTAEQADVLDEADQEVTQALIRRIRNAPEAPNND
jgi:hypothetical protein